MARGLIERLADFFDTLDGPPVPARRRRAAPPPLLERQELAKELLVTLSTETLHDAGLTRPRERQPRRRMRRRRERLIGPIPAVGNLARPRISLEA